MKIFGIILLVAALLVSGAFYFRNDTLQMQQASQAQSQNQRLVADSEESFEVPDEEPLPAQQNQPDEVSTQSIPDIQAISRQIIAVQQQIEGRMVSCVQDAQRAQRAIIALRQQENTLRARRDALNDRIAQTETSTPAGRERRDRLRREQDALEDQRSRVRDQLNNVRRAFNENRTNCRRDISRLRTAQNQLEGAISRQFNQDINVRFSFPN